MNKDKMSKDTMGEDAVVLAATVEEYDDVDTTEEEYERCRYTLMEALWDIMTFADYMDRYAELCNRPGGPGFVDIEGDLIHHHMAANAALREVESTRPRSDKRYSPHSYLAHLDHLQEMVHRIHAKVTREANAMRVTHDMADGMREFGFLGRSEPVWRHWQQ